MLPGSSASCVCVCACVVEVHGCCFLAGGRTRRGFQRSATSVVLAASAAWIFLSKFSAPSGAALVCVFVRIQTGRGVLKCAGVCADAHRLRLLRRLPAPFFVGHAHIRMHSSFHCNAHSLSAKAGRVKNTQGI